jgi:methionine biosynthesis protein MetW
LEAEHWGGTLSLFEPNPEARLLDLGCGDGRFTLKVAARIGTSNVFGIDVVKENVEQAKSRGIACYQADLDEARFPFEDGSFDVVCGNQIIEHLSDTDGFLREIWRVLKPGGHAVIATENLAAWHCIACLLLGLQPYTAHVSDEAFGIGTWYPGERRINKNIEPLHRRLFTLRALRELLSYHGFRVDKSSCTGLFPFPVPLARLLAKLDKLHTNTIGIRARKKYARS